MRVNSRRSAYHISWSTLHDERHKMVKIAKLQLYKMFHSLPYKVYHNIAYLHIVSKLNCMPRFIVFLLTCPIYTTFIQAHKQRATLTTLSKLARLMSALGSVRYIQQMAAHYSALNFPRWRAIFLDIKPDHSSDRIPPPHWNLFLKSASVRPVSLRLTGTCSSSASVRPVSLRLTGTCSSSASVRPVSLRLTGTCFSSAAVRPVSRPRPLRPCGRCCRVARRGRGCLADSGRRCVAVATPGGWSRRGSGTESAWSDGSGRRWCRASWEQRRWRLEANTMPSYWVSLNIYYIHLYILIYIYTLYIYI